jgi:predicted MFS family arabinose efflux permease
MHMSLSEEFGAPASTRGGVARRSGARVRHLHRPASLSAAILGPPSVVRAARVHALNSFAHACFTVSLAGSLFLSVSFEAARPRIIIYLLFTMAPFAVVAPLLGPLVDRVRGGHRVMITAAMVLRAGICVGLAWQLRDLVVFPLAFSMLSLDKTYSVARNALIPRLVPGDDLVSVNSRLSRLATVSGGLGGAVAAVVLTAASARWVPLLGAVVFLLAGMLALRLPQASAAPAEAAHTELAWRELHGRTILTAQTTMLAVKASTGFFLFLLGVGLKSSGAPTWFFGLVFVANGLGNLGGNSIAPALHRRYAETQMLLIGALSGAAITAVATIAANRAGTILAAFAFGLGSSVATQGFNAAIQRHAPDIDRGRTLAAFDTRFQLAWVVGALAAVGARPELRVGFGVLTVVLAAAGAAQLFRRHQNAAPDVPGHEALAELAVSARRLVELGENRAAVLVVVAAADLLRRTGTPLPLVAQRDLDELRNRAVFKCGREISADGLARAFRAVGWAPDW